MSATLGEVCTKITDGTHHSPTNGPIGDFKYITAKNIKAHGLDLTDVTYIDAATHAEIYSRCDVRRDDVLFVKDGATTGRVAINPLDEPFSLLSSVAVFRPGPRIKPRYLLYALQVRDVKDRMLADVAGVAITRLTLKKLNAATIPLAPIAQQDGIVDEIEKHFSRLDEAVANLQRVKANLKRYRDSTLNEYFDGSPNATVGNLIDSGPQNGLYLPRSAYGGGTPILRIDDYQTDWIRSVGELRRVAASKAQVQAWSLLAGDLVVNRVNSMSHLGKCVSIPESLTGTLFESNMMRFRLKPEALPRYVELYLGSKLGKKRLTANAKWAVNQASINQQDVLATPIPIPDLGQQHRIVAEVDRRLSIVRGVEAQVETNLKRAQALRQAILNKAFGG